MSIMMPPGKVMYNLGPATNLPMGEGRNFQIGAATVAVFRTRAGKVFAVQAHCPHKNGPLADGLVGDDKVICPLHAFKFHLASGEALGNTCSALQTYAVSLNESGDVLLYAEE